MGDAEEGDGEFIGDADDGSFIVFDDLDVVFDAGVFKLMTD